LYYSAYLWVGLVGYLLAGLVAYPFRKQVTARLVFSTALALGVGYLITNEYLAPAFRNAAMPFGARVMIPLSLSGLFAFLMLAYWPTPSTVQYVPYLYVIYVLAIWRLLHPNSFDYTRIDTERGYCFFQFCSWPRTCHGSFQQSARIVKVCQHSPRCS